MVAGLTLTIIGSASFIGGIILTTGGGTETGFYGGLLMAGGGAGMLIPGVVHWTRGARTRKPCTRNSQSLYIPSGKVGIGYRF